MLTENDIEKKILSIKENDWNRLFELIPLIESAKEFGYYREIEEEPDGVFCFPHITESEIVEKFYQIVYDIGIVLNFDWVDWEDGKKLLNEEDADFQKCDLITLSKLVTTIVRADRFNEGFLVNCFETGIILKIILAMQKKVNKIGQP